MNIIDNYSEYKTLLIKLHILIKNGMGDSKEADNIRDLMDVHWNCLTKQEIKDLDDLSEHFYEKHSQLKKE
jgi:hypothetical protein